MKYILVLVFILIVAGWFYWFQWRPSEIKKECSRGSLEIATDSNESTFINELEIYKGLYKVCINIKGL